MTNMTLALPKDLHKIMRKHKEVRWSEVARQALLNQAKKMELMEKLLEKSELTEKDALEIGRKINKSMHERYKKEHPGVY